MAEFNQAKIDLTQTISHSKLHEEIKTLVDKTDMSLTSENLAALNVQLKKASEEDPQMAFLAFSLTRLYFRHALSLAKQTEEIEGLPNDDVAKKTTEKENNLYSGCFEKAAELFALAKRKIGHLVEPMKKNAGGYDISESDGLFARFFHSWETLISDFFRDASSMSTLAREAYASVHKEDSHALSMWSGMAGSHPRYLLSAGARQSGNPHMTTEIVEIFVKSARNSHRHLEAAQTLAPLPQLPWVQSNPSAMEAITAAIGEINEKMRKDLNEGLRSAALRAGMTFRQEVAPT